MFGYTPTDDDKHDSIIAKTDADNQPSRAANAITDSDDDASLVSLGSALRRCDSNLLYADRSSHLFIKANRRSRSDLEEKEERERKKRRTLWGLVKMGLMKSLKL